MRQTLLHMDDSVEFIDGGAGGKGDRNDEQAWQMLAALSLPDSLSLYMLRH